MMTAIMQYPAGESGPDMYQTWLDLTRNLAASGYAEYMLSMVEAVIYEDLQVLSALPFSTAPYLNKTSMGRILTKYLTDS